MKCPSCNGYDTVKGKDDIYTCNQCGAYFLEEWVEEGEE